MKKIFTFIFCLLFLLIPLTYAEDLKVQLSSSVGSLHAGDIVYINLVTNQDLSKIEKDFLDIKGGVLQKLESVDRRNFRLTIKTNTSFPTLEINVKKNFLKSATGEVNIDVSNVLKININKKSFVSDIVNAIRLQNPTLKNTGSSNGGNSGSNWSMFGIGALLKMLKDVNFNGAQSNTPSQQNTSSSPASPTQTSAGQTTVPVTFSSTASSSPSSALTPSVQPQGGSSNEIVFVDCKSVKDAPGILAGRLFRFQRFSEHGKLKAGSSHSFVTNSSKVCFSSSDTYALGFNGLDETPHAGGYKFVVFASKTNIPSAIEGKCAIISPNQVKKPTEAVGYLSNSCSGFLNRNYTTELNNDGTVYILNQGVSLKK